MSALTLPDTWAGSLDDLTRLANDLLPTFLPFDRKPRLQDDLNPRLIRHYTTQGLIDAPAREGREARYTRRHLLQLLTLRRLMAEGHSTQALQMLLEGKDDASLEALLLGQSRLQVQPDLAFAEAPAVETEVGNPALDYLLRLKRGEAGDPAASSARPPSACLPAPVPSTVRVPTAPKSDSSSRYTRLLLADGLELHVREGARLPKTRQSRTPSPPGGRRPFIPPEAVMNDVQTHAEPTVELKVQRGALLAGATQELTLLIRVHPASAPRTRSGRPPMNLALVLDRSGSMSGSPLETAKHAVIAALRQLGARDRVSVVSFDDTVSIDIPSTPAHDPEALARQVRRIESGGSTALHAGWLEGAAQVATHLNPGGLNRVILLSDGQANVGLQDAREIARQVQGLTVRGVSTTCMGFGAHYDEDLLLGMATAGDGNFEHIENARTLPTFFESELQGLSRTSGRTVSVGIEPNREYSAEVLEVLNDLVRSGHGRWQLANLIEGQPLSVVARLRLTVPDAQSGAVLGVTRVRLAWTGLDGQRRKVRAQLNLPVLPRATYDALPEDPEVQEAATLLRMAEQQRAAVRAMDAGDRAGALDFLETAHQIGASLPSPSAETAAALADGRELEQLYTQGQDGLARKRALLQSRNRSQSKPRK